MDDNQIQYDAENYAPQRKESGSGGLVGLIMRMGLAKDEKQANTALVVIVVGCIVIGAGVWLVL